MSNQYTANGSNASEALLCIEGLTIERRGQATIVNEVSVAIERGTTTVVVGRSGAGKTTLLLGALNLLGQGWSISGRVTFGSTELLGLDEVSWRRIRGREIAYIPQASALALQPSVRVGAQIQFALRHALGIEAREARSRGLKWLERVGADSAPAWWNLRPTELSGGMTRLVLVAVAFACEPVLVMADEPTVGLDAKGQATLRDLLREGQQERGMGALVVTHEIGFEVDRSDRLAVLEDGRILESGLRQEILAAPQHELTKQIIAAARIPRYQTT